MRRRRISRSPDRFREPPLLGGRYDPNEILAPEQSTEILVKVGYYGLPRYHGRRLVGVGQSDRIFAVIRVVPRKVFFVPKAYCCLRDFLFLDLPTGSDKERVCMKHIRIADTTLCQGNYTFKEKIEIARQLEKLGVDVIELPAITEVRSDTLLVRTMASFVKSSTLSVAAGADMDSIDRAAAALEGAAKQIGRAHV